MLRRLARPSAQGSAGSALAVRQAVSYNPKGRMLPHGRSIRWLLLALLPACSFFTPRQPSERERRASASAHPSALASSATSAGCATGGMADVAQARLELVADGKTATWIDIDVSGQRQDALRACHVLVEAEQREVARVPELTMRLVRPCTTDALVPFAPTTPATLVDRRVIDEVDVAMSDATPGCPETAWPRLRGAVVRASPYDTTAACEEARAALQAAVVKAQADAALSAGQWLDEAIHDAEQRLAVQCATMDAGAADDRTSCGRSSLMLDLLRDRRANAKAEAGSETAPATRMLTCRGR